MMLFDVVCNKTFRNNECDCRYGSQCQVLGSRSELACHGNVLDALQRAYDPLDLQLLPKALHMQATYYRYSKRWVEWA